MSHHKTFVSDVEFKNASFHADSQRGIYKKYYGAISTPTTPSLYLDTECRKETHLGGSIFFIIPIPTFEFREPHDSISKETFSIFLKNKILYYPDRKVRSTDVSNPIDFSKIEVKIELNNKVYTLLYSENALPAVTSNKYVSDLQCDSLINAILHIKTDSGISTSFLLNFYEKVEHNFEYFNPLNINYK